MRVIDTSQRLREARQKAGLTQKELANRIGTHQPAIARAESGEYRIGFDLASRIAAETDTDPLYLMGMEKNFAKTTI